MKSATTTTAADVAGRLVWVADVIALLALALTAEVQLSVFAAVGVMALLSRLQLRFAARIRLLKLTNGILFSILFAIFAVCIAAWWFLRVTPIVAIAHGIPLFHAILWFSHGQSRDRTLRLGLGFVALNVAAILTTEVYLSFALFAFAVVASVALSCGFLDTELSKHAERVSGARNESAPRAAVGTAAPQILPQAFVRSSVWLSFVVLLSSLVIFPILPRSHFNGGGEVGRARVGYNEDVQLSKSFSLSGVGQGQPVLRLYGAEQAGDIDLSTEWIFGGLFRTRTLARFDGRRWYPSRRLTVRPQLPPVDSRVRRVQLEMIREPIESEAIPLPYGTREVQSPDPIARLASGEFIDPAGMMGSTRRLRVQFQLSGGPYVPAAVSFDRPIADHLDVPVGPEYQRIRKLAERIAPKGLTSIEKLQRIREWFRREGFTVIGDGIDPLAGADPLRARMSPLERFLFVDRAGHCELYSTATAMMLRMLGVPTRLVSGFRLSRGPVAGVLSVRSGDAHAWTEVWIEPRGWLVADFTPRVMAPLSWMTYLRDHYEVLGGYWYRYVLGFDAAQSLEMGTQVAEGIRGHTQDWAKSFRELADFSALSDGARLKDGAVLTMIAVVILVITGVFWLGFRMLRLALLGEGAGPQGTLAVRRAILVVWLGIRYRLSLRAPRGEVLERLTPASARALESWFALYDAARFGPNPSRVIRRLDAALRTFLRAR